MRTDVDRAQSAPASVVWGVAACAALAILGAIARDTAIWLHYLFKPLTTLLILLIVWRIARPVNLRYRRAVLAGIALSLLGDVFLMLPKTVLPTGFVLGLSSFLVAHLFFLYALTSDAHLLGRPLVPALLLLFGAANLTILWSGVGPALRVPVLLYMLFLIAMTSQAICRHLQLRDRASLLAAIGGILFMISDTLLAYNRFHAPLPLAPLWILGTYYSALLMIARSVAVSGKAAAATVIADRHST
jgi:uncharacterized membrane protein YhhN